MRDEGAISAKGTLWIEGEIAPPQSTPQVAKCESTELSW